MRRCISEVCSLLLTALPFPAQGRAPSQTVEDRPVVFLNHFFVVVDPDTFHAIAKSRFLTHKFAAFEQRTTTSQNQTCSGLYFYGEDTYIDFFPPGFPAHSP